MTVRQDDILAALADLSDPASGQDIVTAGLVRGLSVEGETARFVIEIGDRDPEQMEAVRAAAEQAVQQLDGIAHVSVAMTAPTKPKGPPPDLGAKTERPPANAPIKIPGVERIIAIASGKGGVGKSTIAANIATALAAAGRRVGLLDADVYGPSQPRMMGINAKPTSPDGKKMVPPDAHGVKLISLGLMMPEGEAVVWRGPMLMGALQQFLHNVQWGDLDVLIVDLPPGTGDAQLTLVQKAVVDGVIIVSTPQDIALLDARKGIDMFRKTKTPIIGLVENMSTHICSNCGHEEHIFGHGGVAAEAERLGVPLLAEIPLRLDVRVAATHAPICACRGT